MLRFAALIAVALMLAPSVVAAQGTEPIGTVSDDETTVSRAFDADPTAGSVFGIFAIGSVAESESQAIGMMTTMPPVLASGMSETIEEAGGTAGAPETVTVTPIGDQSAAIRVTYSMFGAVDGELMILAVRQGSWVQLLLTMGLGEVDLLAQVDGLARQLQPRWPASDPVTVRPDGLRTGGIWNMMPLPEDVPAGFALDPTIEEGPGPGTATSVPAGPGASTPTPSLDLPLLPTPTPAGGQVPPAPGQIPTAETPAPPVSAPIETPAATEVATPAQNPRLALPFTVTVEVFLPLDLATMNEDGSCSGSGLLDGLGPEGQVTLQGATEGGSSAASAPMSGPGQVALDRETGEEICYFRATLTDVPARARYTLTAGETVLGQYTYEELTETGSILVVIDKG